MATIKDVALETGLSVGTVSRIFNNRGYISDEARKKVEDAMRKLNYQPNAVARSLKKSSSLVIGLIVPHIAHPFFSELISHVEDAASRNGHNVLVFRTDGNSVKERSMIDRCRENRVRGVVLCSGRNAKVKLEKHEFPLVTIETSQEAADFSIQCDNREGGRLAAGKLIDSGCRKLLHISSVIGNLMPADDRSIGFAEECKARGVEWEDVSYPEAYYTSLDYMPFIEGLLDQRPGLDGVFCSSDLIASQVLQAASRRGIKVPEDMKVIGFDDTIVARCSNPPLTTIHQPIREMAEMAVSALLGLKDGGGARGKTTMAVRLVERGTT